MAFIWRTGRKTTHHVHVATQGDGPKWHEIQYQTLRKHRPLKKKTTFAWKSEDAGCEMHRHRGFWLTSTGDPLHPGSDPRLWLSRTKIGNGRCGFSGKLSTFTLADCLLSATFLLTSFSTICFYWLVATLILNSLFIVNHPEQPLGTNGEQDTNLSNK